MGIRTQAGLPRGWLPIVVGVVSAAAALAAATPPVAGQEAAYPIRESRGQVTIEARPAWTGRVLRVDLAANTHSVNLAALDLSGLIRLSVEGRELAPDSVGRLAGHHARTTAWFSPPSRPDRFALVIREIPDIPLRTLSWPDAGEDDATGAGTAGASSRSGATGAFPGADGEVGRVASLPRGLVVVGGITPGELAVVDPVGFRVLRLVDGLGAVHGVGLGPYGRWAYALDMGDPERAVSVIDTRSGTLVRRLGLPGPGHHAAADPAGGRVFVAYGEMGLDPEKPRGVAAVVRSTGVVRVHPTEGLPFYLVVDPSGHTLYAAVQGTNRLVTLGVPSLEEKASVTLSGTPSHFVVGPEGRYAYVALVEGRVARVDLRKMEVVAEAETAPDAHAVALAGRPARLFVANRGSGSITVLDPATLRTEATLEPVRFPIHLLESPTGALLVSAGDTRELVEVDPESLEVLRRLPLPFQPHQSAAAR